MKSTYILSFIFIITFSITEIGFSQEKEKKIKTTEFKVKGVCNMCKARIENAALIKGVKFTEWDKETEILKIIYRPDKIKLDDIHKEVAKTGHDTDKIKSTEKSYKKLPACCAYKGNVQKH